MIAFLHDALHTIQVELIVVCRVFRPDPSKIFVCVGFGFFVEFTLTEAVTFIDKKCAHLTSISDSLTQDAARIKAHIKLVLEVSLNSFWFSEHPHSGVVYSLEALFVCLYGCTG